MTVIFIATIDTFKSVSNRWFHYCRYGDWASAFGIISCLQACEQHKTAISTGAFLTITVPLLIVTVISSTFANFMPKQDPIWPDPVPYFKSIVLGKDRDGTGIGNGVKTSGYGTDDTLLAVRLCRTKHSYSKREWLTSNTGKSKRRTPIHQKGGSSCPRIAGRRSILRVWK